MGSQAPTEWISSSLDQIASVEWGNTSITKKQYQERGYPAYSAAGQDGLINEFEHEGKGIVLSAIGARCGKCFFATGQWIAIKNTMVIKPIGGYSPEFLFYYLNDARNWTISGSGQPFITLGNAKQTEIFLPPLAEQKVIADKLDTLLAQVENTKARLERIPQILKRFRQSVLAAAVSGRLTEEWREGHESDEPYEEPLSSTHRIQDEDHLLVPENWSLTAMGNVSTFQQGLQIAKSARRMEPGEGILPILRTVNYENNFKDDVHYAVVNEKSIIAEPEDIILSRTGTVGLVLTGFKGIMHNNSFRLNFQKDLLLRRYLIYFLRSPICQEYVKRESGRSSQPDLTHKAFSKCPVTVPSRAEQTEIVHHVDQLFAHADRIEQQVNNALARVNNLTQSILAKAFRGELTEQWRKDNPELISGENSAEALLERIKAKRPVAKLAKKSRKKASS